MYAVYDFVKLFNDIMTHDNKHWDTRATLMLANAIRGLGIAAGSLLTDNQSGATIKGGLNAVNTAGNVARDFLIRRANNERPKRKKRKNRR